MEAAYYEYLKTLQEGGVISFFLMQVPIHLPAGVKYCCDYMVFYPDGRFEVIDVKGVETNLFKMKKKQVEFLYPFKVKVVKKVPKI